MASRVHLLKKLMAEADIPESTAKYMLEATGDDYSLALTLALGNKPSAAVNGSEYVRPPDLPLTDMLIPPEEDPELIRQAARFAHLQDFRDLTRAQEAMMGLRSPAILGNSSKETAEPGRKTLEELFRPPLDIVFKGNFHEAKEAAALSGHWLLVNIMDYADFSSQVLNRDVWSNEKVRKMLDGRFTLWQASQDYYHGQKYTHVYDNVTSPYIAIIDPRYGELKDVYRKTDAKGFHAFLKEFMSNNGKLLVESPAKQNGTSSSSNSVQDSSTSNNCSSAINGKRKRVSEEGESSSVKRKSVLDYDEEEQMRLAIQASMMPDSDNEYTDMIPSEGEEEPLNNSNWSNEDNKESTVGPDDWLSLIAGCGGEEVTLALRMPQGERETVTLPLGAPVQAIFTFLKARECGSDNCQAFFSYPKKDLLKIPPQTTLSEAGFSKREIITIQKD